MDPAYLNKKIVDLSDAELIALGFLGENAAPDVKRIVETVKARPDHLGTVTCFISSATRFFKIPTKTAHGVFNTPLNDVWHDTVAPRILALIKARGLKYSMLTTARFSTIEDGSEDKTFGPVVVWIAVRPNTTTAGAVRDATPDILRILADVEITDVVVEWYEASVVRMASSSAIVPQPMGYRIRYTGADACSGEMREVGDGGTSIIESREIE
ncbi:unnamed protein product [Cyclocybe aegerita]|uniref:Uncharacterized protein n=1 Tax=Cyclocybe aegerita TaxID=1973307 RepID=A0A8S0X734_CYCAE|nr:unnamed protein product [Cyclocybe aegerita]